MEKIIRTIIFLLLICLAVPSPVWAKERIVQLNLSGCADCNAAGRIERILKKTKGVKKHINKGHGLLIITFDDEITTLNMIVDELKRGKLFVEGEAIFLK
ncbi:MAG: hypothetical protein ABFD57_09820 [Smithella sp.]|nr:hypothetical protein [Syntrophaceae bacterium]